MMELMDFLRLSPMSFGLAALVTMMAMNEFGMFLGRHRRARNEGKPDEATGIVVGSVLGLLAFVLALTLSNANSRFEQRQAAALDESNAISTAWLQAGAVGGDLAKSLQTTMGAYILARYAYVSSPPNDTVIDGFNQATNDLQNKIWADLSTVIEERPGPPATSLMNAINTMFDASQSMRYAMNYHMPWQFIGLLFAMTVVGMASIGYQFGQLGQRGRWPAFVIAMVWTVVVVQILDIGMSRIWSMQADGRTYIWTMQSMGMPTSGLK
ncbi:MAG: hypothetical protein LCH69_08425 [Proteobacteria bacterium]|nr:hypothetical protein [Pseudomonadota bacterium]